jgi:hypothetical protein
MWTTIRKRFLFGAYIVLAWFVPLWLIMSSSSVEFNAVKLADMKLWVFIALGAYIIFGYKKIGEKIREMKMSIWRIIFESAQHIAMIGFVYLIVLFIQDSVAGGDVVLRNVLYFVIAGVVCRILDWIFNADDIRLQTLTKTARDEIEIEDIKARLRGE